MNIPTELITLFSSSIIGGLMRLWGASLRSRQIIQSLSIRAMNSKARIYKDAREYENPGFQWTRRIIALLAAFFIIAFPKLVAVFFPEIAIHIGYPQLSKGFWFFTSDVENVNWVSMNGLAITPLDTHLLSAIIGLYFGGSLIGNK